MPRSRSGRSPSRRAASAWIRSHCPACSTVSAARSVAALCHASDTRCWRRQPKNDDIASNRTVATALTEACLIEYAIKQGGGFSGGRPPLAVRLQALRSGLLGQRALTFAFIAVSSAMLSWVAFFNGAPLGFPDTISYVTTSYLVEIAGMSSAFYGIFIRPLHQRITLWPVVLAQGALMAHLLYLVVRCVTGRYAGKTETLLMVAALCLLSGLPWFTGQIMPDVFS